MKVRLDQLLVDRGLAESRERAQRLIRAGMVLVSEQLTDKPGTKVDEGALLRIKGEVCPYVSRGGLKLAGALDELGLTDLHGIRAMDVGASTGGFTDCLLQRGAVHVWAVDTGRGQLHMKLRQDPRVTLREQANARFLTPDWVDGEAVDLIVIDVSFISLRLVLEPVATTFAETGGDIVALVKPQFEAGRGQVPGGVVRDPAVHRSTIQAVVGAARAAALEPLDVIASPILGPEGNREFLLWIRVLGARPASPADEAGEDALARRIAALTPGISV
jgi:23S rRNA (cytidine1920-2'-O)/16S rRNA (cytidine1409-2'-O)-methyltransferase